MVLGILTRSPKIEERVHPSVHFIAPTYDDLRQGPLPYHLISSTHFTFGSPGEYAVDYRAYGQDLRSSFTPEEDDTPNIFLFSRGSDDLLRDKFHFRRIKNILGEVFGVTTYLEAVSAGGNSLGNIGYLERRLNHADLAEIVEGLSGNAAFPNFRLSGIFYLNVPESAIQNSPVLPYRAREDRGFQPVFRQPE